MENPPTIECKPNDPSACELYETDSGAVVAFLGTWGSDGLLSFHERSGWTFHPAGSVAWDSFHQGVYRNFKADRLASEDLEQRGIPPPPANEYGRIPAVLWKDQFNAEIPLSAVPPSILDRLKEDGSWQRSVYLVLYEDVYETAFGDGCFWYPQAAFWRRMSIILLTTSCGCWRVGRRIPIEAARRRPFALHHANWATEC